MNGATDPISVSGSASDDISPTERRFPCGQCGAHLAFSPGAQTLVCAYCGHQNPVPATDAPVGEQDFRAALEVLKNAEEFEDCIDVKCDGCGSEIHGLGSRTALTCPYCSSNIVATAKSKRLIKPKAVLPFAITRERAVQAFHAWVRGLWFAPSDLKHAVDPGKLQGIYTPAWTYNLRATSAYAGQRGDHYYVTVPYTRTVNGRTVTGTRQERRTRWSPAAGTVRNTFHNVLVHASRSLPLERLEALHPWGLEDIVAYDDAYLSGFAAESYQVDLIDGFGVAETKIRPDIEASVRADIGGDEQRIASLRPAYTDITFKHLLLPVWLSAYRYRGKVRRVFINARTAEVQGDRPWSAIKIGAAIALGLAVAAAILAVVLVTR